jgi:hypothetical protein
MTDKAFKFIQSYEQNTPTYDNGYLLFNPGYFKNKIWFRFNSKKNDWEWSNDLIYWNKNYDINSKSSIWVNSLLDSKNDINHIISYLRLNNVIKNIVKMNDPVQRIFAYIDKLYDFTLDNENNNMRSDSEIKLNYKLMNSTIKNAKEELENIRTNNTIVKKNDVVNIMNDYTQVKIDLDTLNYLNNTIGLLNQEIIRYKSDISNLSNYFTNNSNNIDINNSSLIDLFLIYQCSLLSELDVNSSDSLSDNTELIYKSVNLLNRKLDEINQENNVLKDKLDEQIFEKNLCEKRINANKCTIKSQDLLIKKLQENSDLSKKETCKLILELEGYKNTIEGNTMKTMSLLHELEKKNILINNLISEKQNMIYLTSDVNPIIDLEPENSDHSDHSDDYEILSFL